MNRPEVYFVTGCASGIGRAVADRLARSTARLVATDINVDALEEHAKRADWNRDRVLCRRLDVADYGAWSALVAEITERFGQVDVLLNIAGYLQPAYAHEIDPRDVDRQLDVNVKGVMFGTRAVAPPMVARKSGHIINIASMAAYAPIPGLSLYSASKFAVRAFSLAAASDLEPHGVAVTVVCPDAVATPMLDKQKSYKEAALTFTAPRFLTPEEVCDRLLSDVLERRPLEVAMPPRRKWLARIADLVPQAGRLLRPLLQKQGLARQTRDR